MKKLKTLLVFIGFLLLIVTLLIVVSFNALEYNPEEFSTLQKFTLIGGVAILSVVAVKIMLIIDR